MNVLPNFIYIISLAPLLCDRLVLFVAIIFVMSLPFRSHNCLFLAPFFVFKDLYWISNRNWLYCNRLMFTFIISIYIKTPFEEMKLPTFRFLSFFTPCCRTFDWWDTGHHYGGRKPPDAQCDRSQVAERPSHSTHLILCIGILAAVGRINEIFLGIE